MPVIKEEPLLTIEEAKKKRNATRKSLRKGEVSASPELTARIEDVTSSIETLRITAQ